MDSSPDLTKFVRLSFSRLVDNSWPVEEYTWRSSLILWVLRGIPAGGFLESLMANDISTAVMKTHPANSWSHIVQFMRWLQFRAPKECWGSYENLKYWQSLSNDERTEFCTRAGLLPTPWQLLKGDPNWDTTAIDELDF